MIILIVLEPVKNSYLKNFVKRLLAAFVLEELVIITEAFFIYMSILDEWTAIIWRTYEIIRIFISLSLCYAISLFIGGSVQKIQRLFFIVCGLMIVGAISDHLRYNNGHSGMNYIAFLIIFSFTFYQYTQLRQQTEGEIPRLTSLMILEFVLIVLNVMLIILFFHGGYQQKFSSTVKITIGILQYQKLYMMIMVMTYFE